MQALSSFDLGGRRALITGSSAGIGLALARGLAQAARELDDQSVDASMILFSMWTETIRHMAENGRGNVLFLDGSPQGMTKQLQDLVALQQLQVVGRQETETS